MAITVTEDFKGRGGSINNASERSYTRVFEVTTDSHYIGPAAIRVHEDIPQIGDYYTNGVTDPYDPDYEEDLAAFVNEVTIDAASESAIYWLVTVKYGPGNTAEFNGDPTLWKIRVRFGGERTERVVLFDRFGNPIMNSAGDRFGDPLTVDSHVSTMVITRNERVSTFSLAKASDYSDTVNLYTWNGFAPQTCKMGVIETSDEQFDPSTGIWYYTVTYPVRINPDTWIKQLLDQGFNELDAYDETKPILGRDGQQIADPRPLDGMGHALDGTEGYDSPVVLPFEVENAVDWSGLNLDLSLRLGL